jgi:hypothetical protein
LSAGRGPGQLEDHEATIAPILGGTTHADPSDLIALAVLMPVHVWLGRDVPTWAPDPAEEDDALAFARRVLIAHQAPPLC